MTIHSLRLHAITTAVHKALEFCQYLARNIPMAQITDREAGYVIGKSTCRDCGVSIVATQSLEEATPTIQRFTKEGLPCL